MFDFKNANENQREAIVSVDGPLLIIAGPGTGKTFTLVQRIVYLIEEKNVQPDNIMVATFTEKAAKELITRISNELICKNLNINIREMYIGTFHSICLRIIKENLECSSLKKNFRTIDSFEQSYIVYQNINKFRKIENFNDVFLGNTWNISQEICKYVNVLSEELVSPNLLEKDKNIKIKVLGEVFSLYKDILKNENLLDFSTIQVEAYNLIKNNDEVLNKLADRIQYIMIDEYQDTNFIQEKIIFLLANNQNNVCVVGDDDQGLYRFRGATIRNILEFPKKFSPNECRIVSLNINYRSDSKIIDFYNNWINVTSGNNFSFEWDHYRYEKSIVANQLSKIKSPSVIKIGGEGSEIKWYEEILGFINEMKSSGKLVDYNQIAFLFNSVKNEKVKNLAKYLENHNINVYSPRSELFFERFEIKLCMGILMLLFPQYVLGLENNEYIFLKTSYSDYFKDCIKTTNAFLFNNKNEELIKWIRYHGKIHAGLTKNTDYSYSSLYYELLAFEPFKTMISVDLNEGLTDVRPARNLALLSQLLNKFEYLNNIKVLSGKTIKKNTEKLFNMYFKLLLDGGISEYEDEKEYAPSGCVSFLTIHQSKGMEFPIVIVDSLSNVPKKNYDDLMVEIEKKYFSRISYEPYEKTKYYDFWRLYYTAFSRAQNLLVLSCNENYQTPSKYFKQAYENLDSFHSEKFNIMEFDFKTVKATDLKDTYSFTSDILVYETCPLQYKFYKELNFMPVRTAPMIFGRVVHETIEDIHNAAIRKEINEISEDNVMEWFESNYNSISNAEHAYLAPAQKNAALQQVLLYVKNKHGSWNDVQKAEVDINYMESNYIIEGKVDLIAENEGLLEIVDFKSEKKPDLSCNYKKIQQYKNQLNLYAYLVEQKTNKKVSKMNLYYTGEENGNPIISFPYEKKEIDKTMKYFSDIVKDIMEKNYKKSSKNEKICKNCDFRFYCGKN